MILQRIIFPDDDICKEKELYLKGEYDLKDRFTALIKEGKEISLFSYFNSFSISKWKRYTGVKNIYFETEFKGKAPEVEVYLSKGSYKDVKNPKALTKTIQKPLKEKSIRLNVKPEIIKDDGINKLKINFPEIKDDTGVIYLKIKAEKDTEIKNPCYKTDDKKVNDIRLALIICTFKREAEVKRNVSLLRNRYKTGIENENDIEIFVSDNGNTLKEADLPGVNLFYNKNTGGSGGFTRGMIEACLRRGGFSHVILMDDDIMLDPEIIERAYNFLSFVKEKYRTSLLGGHHISLKTPYLQLIGNENLSDHGLFEVNTYHRYFDLRREDDIAANEIIRRKKQPNYNGWWFCCIPTSFIREDNLPLPFFLHYDDIEYGIRDRKRAVITLNGIGVWHPEFAGKQPISTLYYDMRNWLIVESAARNGITKRRIIKAITDMAASETARYRYEATKMGLRGINTFLKGPKKFMELDAESLHKELLKKNYKSVSPEDLNIRITGNESITSINEINIFKYIKAILLWLLPPENKTHISYIEDTALPMKNKRMFFYNEINKTGYLCKRDYKEGLICLILYFSVIIKIIFKYDKIRDDWKKEIKTLKSLKFWERYLSI